jgi:hypothetical protein
VPLSAMLPSCPGGLIMSVAPSAGGRLSGVSRGRSGMTNPADGKRRYPGVRVEGVGQSRRPGFRQEPGRCPQSSSWLLPRLTRCMISLTPKVNQGGCQQIRQQEPWPWPGALVIRAGLPGRGPSAEERGWSSAQLGVRQLSLSLIKAPARSKISG